MQNRWDSQEAAAAGDDALALRVYSSRLLGAEPDLVLHGGGNTSVKDRRPDFFGEEADLIFVKGSGWDLGTIEAPGFAPVRMGPLLKMAELAELSDPDMVREQRAAMTDPDAPTPSIEAILHAIIPGKFVDHTHADAVVALTNNPTGEQRVRDLFGERVLVVPYVMPGFILAKTIYEMTRGIDWTTLDGMVLMNHGIFTWGEDAKSSYDRMIELVTKAEGAHVGSAIANADPAEDAADLLALASIRKAASELRGQAVLARWNRSPEAVGFASLENVDSLATRGPLTPDHVIRTKRTAAIVGGDDPAAGIDAFAADYEEYFKRNGNDDLTMLDRSPRWAVWKGKGTLAFENSIRGAGIVSDLIEHTAKGIQWGEALGGWQALPESDIFDIEYWELEQAKLKKGGARKPLQGKIALATGAAAGIGRACAEALYEAGAVIVALDLNPEIEQIFTGEGRMGITVNL
ncbi:MAG: rhamnose utilization protein RhaD (predicted bifunctional aldolase and dehydrogenase), partial [Pseudoalteromonas tetraodonis]